MAFFLFWMKQIIKFYTWYAKPIAFICTSDFNNSPRTKKNVFHIKWKSFSFVTLWAFLLSVHSLRIDFMHNFDG